MLFCYSVVVLLWPLFCSDAGRGLLGGGLKVGQVRTFKIPDTYGKILARFGGHSNDFSKHMKVHKFHTKEYF